MKTLQLQLRKSDLKISKNKETNQWEMPKYSDIFNFSTTTEAKVFMLILADCQKHRNIIRKATSYNLKNYDIFTFSLKNLNSSDSIFKTLHCSKAEIGKALTALYNNPVVKLDSIDSNEFTVRIDKKYLNIKKGESYVMDYDTFSKCGSVNQLKIDILTNFYPKHNFHTRFLAQLLNIEFTTSDKIIYAMKRIRFYFKNSQFTQSFEYHNGKKTNDNLFYIAFVRKPFEIVEKVVEVVKKFVGYAPIDKSKNIIDQRKEQALKFINQFGFDRGIELFNEYNQLES